MADQISSKGIATINGVSVPTEDDSNYTAPVATSDPKKFTSTSTAKTAEEAEAQARYSNATKTTAEFGENTTTQAVGPDNVKIKLNDNGTYTATVDQQAQSIAPPAVSPPATPPAPTTPEPAKTVPGDGDPYVFEGQSTIPPATAGLTPPVPQEVSSEKVTPVVVPDPSPAAQQQEKLNKPTSTTTSVDAAKQPAATKGKVGAVAKDDWRIRMSLARDADYLYMDKSIKPGDLLYPLQGTNGVIFPYTPTINSSYRANYEFSDITHTNYKHFYYKNSSVDDLQIVAEFTAQDINEANYLLAVIHFFKSVTKMFYGQDSDPRNGTPPPLVYLTGLGQYQYSNHPLVITSFQYNLPNDVDYIRAGTDLTSQWSGQNAAAYQQKSVKSNSLKDAILNRMKNNGLTKNPKQTTVPGAVSLSNAKATYVPTKIQIQLTANPIVSRGDISNRFSVKDYASGKLLKGSGPIGGIW